MGSPDWLKTIISLKRSKHHGKKLDGSKSRQVSGGSRKNAKFKQLTEDAAAVIIQSSFRAYRARKALRRLRGIVRIRGVLEESHAVKNQASSALNHIHFWSRIQAEIKARWMGMVTEGRTRQRKLENQLKLESKIHELEVEWNGGPETMDEILNRIQQREEAAAKRERSMAYAFSHQWRANSGQHFGQAYYDLSKESWGWGWSWRERWIAVRPWETRFQTRPVPVKKIEAKQKKVETTNSAPTKATVSSKPVLSNGKVSTHAGNFSRVTHEATV